MNLSYDNIPNLYGNPCSDPDYMDTWAEDQLIKCLYRLHNMIEYLFMVYPPISLTNRLCIVHKLRDVLVGTSYDMPYTFQPDNQLLESLMDQVEDPDKETLWQYVREYLHRVICNVKEAAREQPCREALE